MTAQQAVLDRLRAALGSQPEDERRMFGRIGIMLGGQLALSVAKDGSLLVRVADDRSAQLQQRPGVRVGRMGERSMGPRWLVVDHDRIASAEALQLWIDEAFAARR